MKHLALCGSLAFAGSAITVQAVLVSGGSLGTFNPGDSVNISGDTAAGANNADFYQGFGPPPGGGPGGG